MKNKFFEFFFRNFFLKILVLLAIFSLLFVFIDSYYSFILGVFFYGLVLTLWIIYQAKETQRLIFWLKSPTKNFKQPLFGPWKEIYSELKKIFIFSEKQKEELNRNISVFKRTAEVMSDGVIILDKNNHIIAATPQAENYLNIKSEKDKGKSIINFIRNPIFVQHLKSKNLESSFILEDLNIEKKALEIKIAPYDNEERLLICRDVTKLRKLEIEKKDFVANVSHELKTPLTILSGYLETLIEVPISDIKKRQIYSEMSRQSKRMSTLINDLLFISKIHHTKKIISKEEKINIKILTREICNDLKLIKKNKKIKINLNIEANCFLVAEKKKLRSAFSNLIKNAIMYSKDKGEINIYWGVNSSNLAEFTVEDSGIGIQSNHIEKLTERFYRVDIDRSRKSGGTGLGLSIVKEIADEYNARLEINSKLGIGSSFKLIFPSTFFEIN